MAVNSLSYLYQPRTVEEIRAVFELAYESGLSVALRGGGRSYGDASLNEGGLVLDVTRMNKVLDWNPQTGQITLEPGATIEKLWKTIIPDGWWPPVVSGTMFTTMAGCAAMNIHGKNNFKAGPFGNHIIEFDILLPTGELKTCSRAENADLFHAAIGGFGMLGCFTRVTLQMKKIHSGNLWVEVFSTRNIQEMVDEFEDRVPESDYLVGWIDCTASGRGLGRGIVHQAGYLPEGVDPAPRETLRVSAQELPTKIFGAIPKSMVWWPLGFFMNNWGMRLVNTSKYWSTLLTPRGHRYYQPHAAFAFLLDYVPNWKWSYRPGGLIQYQSFLPRETAVDVYEKLIRISQREGLPPYLGVFKKHQPDPFWMTHAVDGYSLALDYRVAPKNRRHVWALCRRLDRIVLDAGGRFYFAKDATLQEEAISQFFPSETIDKFIELKNACDPDNVLQTNLSRRLFGEKFEG